MIIETSKFGEIQVEENKQITFIDGVPGFEHLKKYTMLEDEDGVFYYLQSLEDGEVAFPIVDPYVIHKEYAPHIGESYFEKLGGGSSEEFSLFVITTIREQLEETTVNL
ncbi:MAG: flagellar assembly protein FliW, partial [Cellulosilyticaceae bacterium]